MHSKQATKGGFYILTYSGYSLCLAYGEKEGGGEGGRGLGPLPGVVWRGKTWGGVARCGVSFCLLSERWSMFVILSEGCQGKGNVKWSRKVNIQ